MTKKQRLLLSLTLFTLALLAGAGWGFYEQKAAPSAASGKTAPLMTAAKVGGPFTLTDQDGRTVTERDFSSTYKMIYFGFTYCPAICPTELQKMAEAMKMLPPDTAARIQPIFISIDPERDTAKVLKDYVPMFDKRLIGLTGTNKQVDAIKAAYKVYAAKVPQDDTYTMDHSSFIYVMTPEDTPLYMFRTTDTAELMAQTLTAYFAEPAASP